jgi:hypothetical protein
MSNKKEPTDLKHLGGRKILEPVPEGPKERIDLSHIGGKRIGERQFDAAEGSSKGKSAAD